MAVRRRWAGRRTQATFALGVAAALGGMLLISPPAQAQTHAAKHKTKATPSATASTTPTSTATSTTSTTTTPAAKSAAALPGYGVPDFQYKGAGSEPTADKPQSKLWYTDDDIWWAVMYATKNQSWDIFKLDSAHKAWSDTGTAVDSRANTRADALFDGTHLYIATHVIAADSSSNTNKKPAYLNSYTYSNGKFSRAKDDVKSATITTYSSESITLDKDSNGTLWATWTQGKAVYVNSSTSANGKTWGTPFGLPVKNAGNKNLGGTAPTADDISSVIAYDHKIGLMWSNQATSSFYFAIHKDGEDRTAWASKTALTDAKIADDHINLKADGNRVFAGVKTSKDALGSQTLPQTLLLSRDPGSGDWSSLTFGTIADCHTRPQIVIDSSHHVVHMFATAPSEKDCTNSGQPGTIYEKITKVDDLKFVNPDGSEGGRGTPVIRDPNAAEMNDVTDTKQNVTSDSKLIIMASNDLTTRYWHAEVQLATP
jgi:hypothetical protein